MRETKLPGLNIQAPWARLLIEGKKTIETRTYPLPEKYRGQDLWLIETPGQLWKFKARVIGVIRFSRSKLYSSSAEFYDDSDQHLIEPANKSFNWIPSKSKFGWIVEFAKSTSEFDAPRPRGIVYARPFAMQERLNSFE